MDDAGKLGDEGHHWRLLNDVLQVRQGEDFETPTAIDVYELGVENREGLLPPLRFDRPLEFSKYPLLLELRIQPKAPSADGLQISVAAVDQAGVDRALLSGVAERVADHVVAGERWYPFARGALDEVKEVLQLAGVGSSAEISLKQYLQLVRLSARYSCIRDLSAGVASAESLSQYSTGEPTHGFKGILYPYQLMGFRWLSAVVSQEIGGILADEMGLGKTVQLAAVLAALKDAGVRPTLVVATGTLLENWRRELAQFAPTIQTIVHRGSDRTGSPAELFGGDLVITSYDTVVRDISLLREIEWHLVVLDEAQAIKNSETKRTQAIKRLRRKVAIAMTGTPVENRLSDLWSILDFAVPGYLPERREFDKHFPDDGGGAVALAAISSPVMLRRRVGEVAKDLPPRIDMPQALLLDEESADQYEAIRTATIEEFGDAAGLVSLTRLRQFCAHRELVEPGSSDLAGSSPKYQRLIEILEEIVARREKAILFTAFTKMIDLLMRDLPDRLGIPCSFIDGRTAIEDRQATVDRFGEIDGGSVLVLNPRAAGVGLNITAANHVIHYTLEWNPAVEDQASARAFRKGQTRPVTVHRLFYVATVEEVIDERLQHKRELSEIAVVGNKGDVADIADIAAALHRSPLGMGRNQ